MEISHQSLCLFVNAKWIYSKFCWENCLKWWKSLLHAILIWICRFTVWQFRSFDSNSTILRIWVCVCICVVHMRVHNVKTTKMTIVSCGWEHLLLCERFGWKLCAAWPKCVFYCVRQRQRNNNKVSADTSTQAHMRMDTDVDVYGYINGVMKANDWSANRGIVSACDSIHNSEYTHTHTHLTHTNT